MEMNRRALLLTSAALAANVVAPEAAFAQEQPRRGGIMTVHFPTEQRILNPSLQASTGVYIVGGKIQEPLVDLDAAGNPAPCLAESWEATPDGKTITFKLRQGVTWHDGRPFTSADVQFTAMEMWKKILNYGTTLQLFLDAVDTPDAHTAIFRYSRPMPLNLLLRALPDLGYVSAKHIYEGTDIRQNPANTAPMGTGPFRFVQYERGQFIIADRNPNYWRNNMPYLDRVVWRVVSDRSAAAAQMESGQLLFSPFSALSIADFTRARTRWNSISATRSWPISVCAAPLRMRWIFPSSSKTSLAPSPRLVRGRSQPPRPISTLRICRNTPSTAPRRTACWMKPVIGVVRAACASICGSIPRLGVRISRFGPPSSSNH
jgi:peptide/nickel transport system substrate-binding protein